MFLLCCLIFTFLLLLSKSKEDYTFFYGKMDYNGKKILDVGADWGSTALFFLRKGASTVIAVEGNPHLFKRLQKNSETEKRIVPVGMWITNAEQFIDLFLQFKPHIAKIDCEGCETSLLKVPDTVFSMVPEYIVETHKEATFQAFINKFIRNRYDVTYTSHPHTQQVKIIYGIQK